MAILGAQTQKEFERVWEQQNVSRETFSDVLSRLEPLVVETLKWQKAINLIAPKTIPDIWTRHILDSFQLIPFLPKLEVEQGGLIDLGSGGGFPGILRPGIMPDFPRARNEMKNPALLSGSDVIGADCTLSADTADNQFVLVDDPGGVEP